MMEYDNLEIEAWLQKAHNDLLTADRLISIEPVILDIACFHCQQAIEKFLKAFLFTQSQSVGRTHNIDFLLSECIKFNSEFDQIDVMDISVYAVIIRYPNNFLNPELEEVKKYYSVACEVKLLVEKLIQK